MIDRTDLRSLWEFLVLVAPAPIGALIGLRYATAQTPRARCLTWLCSSFVGAIAGGLAGELMMLSAYGIAFATIVCASAGMEIIAGVIGVARAFKDDPFGLLAKAADLASRFFGLFRRSGP